MNLLRHEDKYGDRASLWRATAGPAPSWPSLREQVKADVVVVGAGFTGASAALALAQMGRRVVLLEAGEPGFGASGRSTGGVAPDTLMTPPEAFRKKYGETDGQKIVDFVDRSVDTLKELIAGFDDDCDLRLNGYVVAAHHPDKLDLLKGRLKSLQERGHKARLLDGEETRTLTGSPVYRFGGYFLENAGHINPMKLVWGLAKAADRAGARIFAHSPARSITRAGDRWLVTTPEGSVEAGKVVLAQGAYASYLWPGLKNGTLSIRPWNFATAPLPSNLARTIIPDDVLVGDSRPSVLHIRKDVHGRLIIPFPSSNLGGPPSAKEAEALAKLHFPQLLDFKVQHLWFGMTSFTPGEAPRLVELADGVWSAFGFLRGVTLGPAMGNVLAQAVTGTPRDQLPFPVTELEPIPGKALKEMMVPYVTKQMNKRSPIPAVRRAD